MHAVVGGGFGLYGYVPAIARRGGTILLARRYEPAFMARPELQRYGAHVRWVADVDEALARASRVVLAVPPAEQPALVERCCALPNIESLVLEKPITADPAGAGVLLDRLERARKRYRIGYSLLHAGWSPIAWPRVPIAIDWAFMAHHFTRDLHNWKRFHAQGGGVLRFFGVHVFALLAQHGYSRVTGSSLAGDAGEPSRWKARFENAAGGACTVAVDSRSERTAFRIEGDGLPLVDLRDPFEDAAAPPGEDRRIPVLSRLLASFDDEDASFVKLYREANALWSSTEQITPVA